MPENVLAHMFYNELVMSRMVLQIHNAKLQHLLVEPRYPCHHEIPIRCIWPEVIFTYLKGEYK